MKKDFINDQRNLYNKKAINYFKHHGDPYSQKYRDRFIRKPLFCEIDLRGKKVLDAMAAFGPETGFLINQGADVTGIDISPVCAQLYKKKWNRNCVVASIHETGFPDSYFDIVYICGGLHHIIPLIDETIKEIHRILKPAGYFCFMEPNGDTWMNIFRVIWYRLDKRFGNKERAINYAKELKILLFNRFKEVTYKTYGNLAYIIIGQSLIVGLPPLVKRLVFQPLFVIEKFFDMICFVPKLYFLGVWMKI